MHTAIERSTTTLSIMPVKTKRMKICHHIKRSTCGFVYLKLIQTVTLTKDQIPAHNHTAGKYDSSGIANGAVDAGGSYQAIIITGSSATERIKTNNTGGGKAHSNLQPYMTLYMWRRTS